MRAGASYYDVLAVDAATVLYIPSKAPPFRGSRQKESIDPSSKPTT